MKHIATAVAATAALALMPCVARAQSPSQANPSAYAPNMYNRAGQPLSPYLNLLRGSDPAVNYFYGVRPGMNPAAFMGMFGTQGAGPRVTFFPGADTLADLVEDPRDLSKVAPTGHPAAFNNTLNYFGTTPGQFYARGGQTRRGR
jgi:hypothetical protein